MINHIMMLLLNTVKLVLIALNILPNRMKHKKIMFFIYMGTLVTHGKNRLDVLSPPLAINYEAINYHKKRRKSQKNIESSANEKLLRRGNFHCEVNN